MESEAPLQDCLLSQVREMLVLSKKSQKEVAEFLGLPATRLSEYLANPPKKRPNGEKTLKLQKWIEENRNSLQKE